MWLDSFAPGGRRFRVGVTRAAAACAALSAVVASAGTAAAYCRTHTCEFTDRIPCPQDDLTGCYSGGEPVSWSNSCITFAVQRDGSVLEGIAAEELEELVRSGFETWSGVACPSGGTPAVAAVSQGFIACDAVEYNCADPEANVNVITFRDEFEDTPVFGFGTIALTTLTANLRSGEIFDADIEINSRDEDFTIGSSETPGIERDLRGVINHELGHMLGLDHSRERAALMFEAYEGRLEPSADDIAGLCAIVPGAAGDPECSAELLPSNTACLGPDKTCSTPTVIQDPEGGCACRAAASSPGGLSWAGVGAGLLALLARRRSRQAS